jgi:hypothetical protein
MAERHGLARYTRKVRRIEDRVSRIWTCIAAGLGSPFVRDYLEQLRRWDGCGPRDFRRMFALAHYTTAAMVTYTPDPPTVDEFKSLEWIRQELQQNGIGRGDCGTYTALKGTMMGAWGARVGCRVIAQGPSYDHVHNVDELPGIGVVYSDASPTPTPRPGWKPPRSKFWASRDFWLTNLAEWIDWFYSGAEEGRMPRV